jgi:hypothetical protein
MRIRAIINDPREEAAAIIEGTVAQVMGQIDARLPLFRDVAFLVGTDRRTRRAVAKLDGEEWAVLVHTL